MFLPLKGKQTVQPRKSLHYTRHTKGLFDRQHSTHEPQIQQVVKTDALLAVQFALVRF